MKRLAALFAAVLLVSAAIAAPPVAAQSDDAGVVEELFGSSAGSVVEQVTSDPIGFAETISAAAGGWASSNSPFSGADRTPSECASDIKTEINDNSATYETYINDRVNASTDRDVVRVECTLETRDGLSTDVVTETIYLTADVNTSDDSYENISAVDTTDRTVDHTVTLSGAATTDGPDDLVEFREEYAEENETPPQQYQARIGGKYSGDVTGTFAFLPDE